MRRTPDRRLTSRHLRVGAAIAVLSAAFAACSSDTASSPTSTSSRAKSGSEVALELIAFKPAALDVTAGTTVAWRQQDPGSHTVTSGTVEQGAGGVTGMPDETFRSGELTTNESFEFAFAEPGTYPYFCEIHPATMRGEITVR